MLNGFLSELLVLFTTTSSLVSRSVDFRCCPFFPCLNVLKIAVKTALKMREFPFQRPKNLKISRGSLPPEVPRRLGLRLRP